MRGNYCVDVLPWAAITISADILGYEGAEQTSYTGLAMCQARLFGALIYLIPLALIVIELVEQIHLLAKSAGRQCLPEPNSVRIAENRL